MDETEKTLREELEKHLDILHRNLQVVSMEVLKTKYEKPYQELKDHICKAATAYTRHITLRNIYIKEKYNDEAKSYINQVANSTPYLKKISEAAFKHQNINEITTLAMHLRDEFMKALHFFYLQHMTLYISKECMEDYHQIPEIYNDATAQIWRNGKWTLMEDTSLGVLLPVEAIYEIPSPDQSTT